MVLGIAPIFGDPRLEATEIAAPEPQRRPWLRSQLRANQLPPELRRIALRSAITRAELAVLLSVQLDELIGPAARDRVVILTDTRDHWADAWVQAAARAGVMAPNPTHKFEPDGLLQRQELAEAVAAVLKLTSGRDPTFERRLRRHRTEFADLKLTHIGYRAASTAVAAGVIELRRGGFFFPTATVHGAEALDVIRRLKRLTRGRGTLPIL